MVTGIYLFRSKIITKEKMESYCKDADSLRKDSVNDDLESLFENIRLRKEPDGVVETYFLPKLTKKELKLVERRETNYLETFTSSNPDVGKVEMMLSESDSKYVKGLARRRTFVIKNNAPLSKRFIKMYDNSRAELIYIPLVSGQKRDGNIIQSQGYIAKYRGDTVECNIRLELTMSYLFGRVSLKHLISSLIKVV